MKKLLLFLCTLSCYGLWAQAKLNGIVVDKKTKTPLSYVTILCKDTTLISGGITNENGKFSIKKLPLKTMSVDFQFIGYKTLTKTITFSETNSSINLGTIYLTEDTELLQEVEIQGETTTITKKIDRRVVNIGKDLTATGSNGYELMQNIPGVTVDAISGTISLRGNKNARVLIDGKPSTLSAKDALKQLPATSIKSVELITNPSAKYSPDGMSGILNIILKKNTKDGFNGVVNLGVNFERYTRFNSALTMNYRTGKVNFFTTISGDIGKVNTLTDINRTDKKLDQSFNFIDDSTGEYLKFGADIYINENNTLSFYTNQNFTDTDFTTKASIFETNGQTFSSNNLQVYDISEASYNADYKVNLDDKGQNLEVELNYTKSKDPEIGKFTESINPSSMFNNYENTVVNDRTLYLANVDYTKPLSEKTTIETGIEARILKVDNQIYTNQEATTVLGVKPVGNSFLDYTRDIYAAYINYNTSFGKFGFQGGLRFEQFNILGKFSNSTQSLLPDYKDEIFNVFPAAYFTYTPNDNNEFSISYSRRIDRPAIYQISPIQEWSSHYTISIGNPDLKPQYTNSIEADYTHYIKTGYLYFNAYYRKTNNAIGRSSFLDAANPDRQYLGFDNYDNSDSYGLEFQGSLQAKKWWTITPIVYLYIQDRQGIIDLKNVTVNNANFTSILRNNFKISNKLSTQLDFVHVGKDQGILYTREAYNSISAGASLKVLKGKGDIKIRVTDIFDILDLKLTGKNPYPVTGFVDNEIRRTNISFTYNFGGGKNKARSRKNRDDNETGGGDLF